MRFQGRNHRSTRIHRFVAYCATAATAVAALVAVTLPMQGDAPAQLADPGPWIEPPPPGVR